MLFVNNIVDNSIYPSELGPSVRFVSKLAASLFAKKDRANLENDELLAFRLLANSYAGLTEQQV
jgi:hypothetical protein